LPSLREEPDILFPANERTVFSFFKKKVYWIPDFQELHYPFFFNENELKSRRETHAFLVQKKSPIIFSSKNAQSDFQLNYPEAVNSTYVVPFAVTIPDLSGIHFGRIRSKYKLEGEYFISSNQFWVHKNHMVVIQAVQELKRRNLKVLLLFTGKPFDNRNPDYYSSLVKYVKSHDLEDEIRFLGFIDRIDQFLLLKHSQAIIQPSLFEGWSTVVEDGKALHHPLLVSDIPVHREQLGEKFLGYFKPDDPQKLSQLMAATNHQQFLPVNKDYRKSVLDFAYRLLGSFKEIALSMK